VTDDFYGRFSIDSRSRPGAWPETIAEILHESHVVFLVLLAIAGLMLSGIGSGLSGPLTRLALVLLLSAVAALVVALYFLKRGDFVALGTRGLTLRSLWPATVHYQIICVLGDFQEFSRDRGSLSLPPIESFRRRWFIRSGRAPNVVIVFHVPVRLGLCPFRWYRAASFAADRPQEFLDALRVQLRDRGVNFEEMTAAAQGDAGAS
jgi:hypothetical protein